MNINTICGIALLIIGIVLMIVGYNATHSIANHLSTTFTGELTNRTAWYLYGGGALAIVGLLLVIFGLRSRRTVRGPV